MSDELPHTSRNVREFWQLEHSQNAWKIAVVLEIPHSEVLRTETVRCAAYMLLHSQKQRSSFLECEQHTTAKCLSDKSNRWNNQSTISFYTEQLTDRSIKFTSVVKQSKAAQFAEIFCIQSVFSSFNHSL